MSGACWRGQGWLRLGRLHSTKQLQQAGAVMGPGAMRMLSQCYCETSVAVPLACLKRPEQFASGVLHVNA
jgi:hypothetical protein